MHRTIFTSSKIIIFLFVASLLPVACATVPKPVSCPVPGKEIVSLLSPISLSVKAGEKNIGGRGYLIYRSPDRFHLVILSPFGLTLFEVFTAGDRITCIVPSKDTAYTGLLAELPDDSPLKSWGMMHWVADRPLAEGPFPSVQEHVAPDGRRELVTYDERGLVQGKQNDEGDRVFYRDYEDVSGVALPRTMELVNSRGETVRIVFDEPEVNQPVEESTLAPSLEGLTILPLSSFRGW